MKIRVLILCFWAVFSLVYTPIVYSEIKKPELGTEIKPDCKECHSRNKVTGGSAKPTAPGQLIKGEGKPIPPPDHIKKDKRKNKGQQ